MKKGVRFLLCVICSAVGLAGTAAAAPMQSEDDAEDYKILKQIIVLEFSGETPHEWGDTVSGVKTHLKTDEKVVALGLDMKDQDEGLNLLRAFESENIPATLFVSGDWIDRNADILKKLAANPLFEIANQGLARKPCSVNGKSAADVAGTGSVDEVFTEIEKNARKIESITGILPQYYRAGAGYYDEVAVRIVNALGYEAVGSNLRLPEGTELTREKVLEAMLNPASGAIAIFKSGTLSRKVSGGILEAVHKLRAKGYKFVKLSDFQLE